MNFTEVGELNNTPKQLVKIVDLLGRKTPFKPNAPLLYIYDDGSMGTLHYFSNGDSSMAKERFEVFCQERIAVLDNYKTLDLISAGRTVSKTARIINKGMKTNLSSLTVDVGLNHGVLINQAVLTPEGIVGKIRVM